MSKVIKLVLFCLLVTSLYGCVTADRQAGELDDLRETASREAQQRAFMDEVQGRLESEELERRRVRNQKERERREKYGY